MAKKLGVYRCASCGYTLEVLELGEKKSTCTGSGYSLSCFIADAKVVCCGKPMEMLEPNKVDASTEKHVPAGSFTEGHKLLVKVGEVAHPMLAEHHIQWIAIAYGDTVQRVKLEPGQAPEAIFSLANDVAELDMYAYCNLHGLWQATFKT